MSHVISLGSVIFSLTLAATLGHAQISDNESSATVLASYCARSSGMPASNYQEYCRNLAETISQLPIVAQKRVFEDKLPVVDGGGGAINASDQARANASNNSGVVRAANNAQGGSDSGSSETDTQNSSRGGKGSSNGENNGSSTNQNSNWGGLLDFVKAINNFLFGENDGGSRAIIGGQNPAG